MKLSSRQPSVVLLTYLCFSAVFVVALGQGYGLNWTPGSPFQDPTKLQSVDGVLQATLVASVVNGLTHYNGSFMPPSFFVRPGDTLRLTIVNQLNQSTNVHFHGLDVSPDPPSDDSFLEIDSSTVLSYTVRFPPWHSPGVYYYHSHTMMLAQMQVAEGLSGLIVIEGLLSPFPGLANLTEHYFALKDLQIINGTVPSETDLDPNANTTRFVNGLYQPILRVRENEVQLWRFANVGPNVYYNLSLSNGMTLHQVARDGPLLRQPLPAQSFLLPPSSRADFLVVGPPAGVNYTLSSSFLTTGPGGDNETGAVLMTVQVTGEVLEAVALPGAEQFPNMADLRLATLNERRTIVFSENDTAFFINGQYFDPNYTMITAHVGDTEEWTIVNNSTEWHVFHIHQLHFQVVSINGAEQPFVGLQDTVSLPYANETTTGPGQVVILLQFSAALLEGKFLFHCHIMQHEDNGMMAVLELLP